MAGEKLVEEWECRVLDKLAFSPPHDKSRLLKFHVIIWGEGKITQFCH